MIIAIIINIIIIIIIDLEAKFVTHFKKHHL